MEVRIKTHHKLSTTWWTMPILQYILHEIHNSLEAERNIQTDICTDTYIVTCIWLWFTLCS